MEGLGVQSDSEGRMKDPRPNIGILVWHHDCPGGNIWMWTDDEGNPTRAACGGCNEEVEVVFHDSEGRMVDAATREILAPGKASRQ